METTEEKRATFTPGPWHAHGTRVSTWETQDEIDFHGDEVIAETGFNANARLIAAAPGLLEQCKLFEKVLCELKVQSENCAYAEYAYHQLRENGIDLDKLREVLAKVEGGEG